MDRYIIVMSSATRVLMYNETFTDLTKFVSAFNIVMQSVSQQ